MLAILGLLVAAAVPGCNLAGPSEADARHAIQQSYGQGVSPDYIEVTAIGKSERVRSTVGGVVVDVTLWPVKACICDWRGLDSESHCVNCGKAITATVMKDNFGEWVCYSMVYSAW